MSARRTLPERVGWWSASHPARAMAVWLVFVAAALVAGSTAGAVTLTDAGYANGEAGRGWRTIEHGFTLHATEQVLVESHQLTVSSPDFRSAVNDVVTWVNATGLAINMQSPLTPGNSSLISTDRHAALVQFDIVGRSDNAGSRIGGVVDAVARAGRAHPALRISEAGDATLDRASDETVAKDLKNAERLSIPITLFVLLFTFGALVAALVPLALALTAILAAMGLLDLASRLTPITSTADSVLLLIGLAVGVDYSLFYLKREREERAAGRDPDAALRAAAATSGRSVLISGGTVLLAMSGMFLAGNGVFYGSAVAAMLVVAIAVAGSLTALPAMLALLGSRVERGRLRLPGRLRPGRPRQGMPPWQRGLAVVLRHPLLAVIVAGGAMLALAAPVAGMRTATPNATDLPASLPVMVTYNRIQALFPGDRSPAYVVIQAADVTATAVQNEITALKRRALASGRMSEPMFTTTSADHTVALISIPLAGNGEDATSFQALSVLRHTVVPATIGRLPGTRTAVTGVTAGASDFDAVMAQREPLIFGFVLSLAFILLLLSFRSLVVALKAIILNLLSVGAAYGVLVLVFQDGYGASVLGIEGTQKITSWVPIFLFVVLFGLSMDYHIFILGRIREAVDRGESATNAVALGISSTAGTVTAAAVVMVFVFLTFAALSQVALKEMGIGLASAVALDATLVRVVLLPASMTLLGDANWYLPGWLEWLPRVSSAEPAVSAGMGWSRGPAARVRHRVQAPLRWATWLEVGTPVAAGAVPGPPPAIRGSAGYDAPATRPLPRPRRAAAARSYTYSEQVTQPLLSRGRGTHATTVPLRVRPPEAPARPPRGPVRPHPVRNP